MSDWVLVFLGVIALASLTQTAFLVVLALEGRKLAAKVDALRDRFEKDLHPSLVSLQRISGNLEEVSELGVQGARRIDRALQDTLDKVESATEQIRNFLVRPLGPIGEVTAFVKGVKRGYDVYRQLRGYDGGRRGSSRSYAEDEHLFI
jgi:hypothetical protein